MNYPRNKYDKKEGYPFLQKSNPMRQRLTKNKYYCWSTGENPIRTLEQLREHLQTAMQVELSTIPPYLCALYSIKEGTNQESARIIQSVVMEEMLHLVMVANIINALGFNPQIDGSIVKPYPTTLPF